MSREAGPAQPQPLRQEDVPPGVPQRATGATGVATPIEPADEQRIRRNAEVR